MADQAAIGNDEIRHVQDYMRREFNTLIRPLKHLVYHYTDGAAGANILEETRVRATNILYLDDGREMQHSLEWFRRAMELRLQAHPNGVTAELNAMIDRYLSEVGSYVPPDIWIVTLTTVRDSTEQWHAMQGRGHAVALGFSAGGIMRAADAGNALLAPCCYDDATKVAIMGRGLELLETLYQRRAKGLLKSADAAAPLVRYVVRELALFGALMKRSDLAHQDEWRLVLCNPSQTAVGARRIKALATPDYTSLYIDLDLADATGRLPIEEILIGPSPYQQMTERAFRTLLYKHGYDRADVVPSKVSVAGATNRPARGEGRWA